ncbi:MAG: NACHT domain-containing protein, partial [Thermoguttaceae bacterium]|nr:NACHT domain-containing protein [Thermoguttaceae bacterium]
MSSAGLLPDRWAEFCRLVLRECSEEWARAKLSPGLPRTLELFLEAAEFPTGDRQLDGFAEPFRTAVLDFFRAGEELGRQINGFKKTSELIEAFLKRLLLLTDPERLEKLHVPPPHWQSPHYKPSLGDLLGRRGLRSLSAPENIAKAAGRAIQIRNRVHESPEWTLREMSQGMVDCLLTVLWATAQYAERLENVLFAKPWEPYLHMLERRWKEHLDRWILLTADEVPMPEEELFDLTAEEVGWQGEEAESVDEIDRTEEEGPFRSEELEEAEREELVEREERFLRRLRTLRQGRVHELFDEVRRLVLVAEAGAGKTTSLQHYAALRAAESLARPYGCRWLPLFVELRHYSPQGLRRLLLESFGVEVDEGRFRRQLAQGRWFLLLDGLNEVPASLLEAACGEIEGLTQHYPQAPVVLTSRSGLPVERFGLQIFRLHPLTDGQIEQFLQRHFSSREECTRFIAALRRNPRLWQWGRNPLQLWMLVQVGLRTKAELPANRGQLLDRFMTFLLTREERKGGQSPRDVKEDLLAELGFRTRSEGRITFRPDLGWGIVRQRCQEMGFNVDAGAFLRELCSNNLLVDLKENVAFAHEMYQEFFAAKGLQKRFAQSPDILDRLKGDRLWEEPIVLLYGLMNSHEGVFKRVLSGQPALAAECLASNIQPQVEQAELLAQEVRTLDYAAASEEKLVSVLRAIYVLGDG